MARAFLARGFHLKGVVNAVEVIENTSDGRDLNDLSLVKIIPKLPEKLVTEMVRIRGELLGKLKRHPLPRAEHREIPFSKRRQLRFRGSEPPCQGGVRVQSIFAAVDVGNADGDHFLQLFLDRSGIHHHPEMVRHRLHDFRPMRHGAEHIGNVPALFEEMVENFPAFGSNLIGREFGQAGHGVFIALQQPTATTSFPGSRREIASERSG